MNKPLTIAFVCIVFSMLVWTGVEARGSNADTDLATKSKIYQQCVTACEYMSTGRSAQACSQGCNYTIQVNLRSQINSCVQGSAAFPNDKAAFLAGCAYVLGARSSSTCPGDCTSLLRYLNINDSDRQCERACEKCGSSWSSYGGAYASMHCVGREDWGH